MFFETFKISKFRISCVKIPCFHDEPENGHLADCGRRQRFLDMNLCTKMHSFTFGHKNLDFLCYFDNTSRDLEFSRVSMHLVWYVHGFDHF